MIGPGSDKNIVYIFDFWLNLEGKSKENLEQIKHSNNAVLNVMFQGTKSNNLPTTGE